MQRNLRRALLAKLKADADLIALVPAASVYPQAVPGEKAWPFIKLGPPVTIPFRASCVRGSQISVDVHAFARARIVSGQEVETAEDHASRIGAAIEAAIDCSRLTLADGALARIKLTDIRLLQDEEPDAFHYFAQVNARVLAPEPA
ncbi:DUF3168 domain-containing protein [Allopontixanthobacter sediminis]|uniref:DUF3168 domain-containing protein n=1 Tax=Allopontixanthobacter sediminis TaxID=1689985 RepID=A0A845AYH5_9SPHN|nr:DUF3168 domain-containing protein [Allopontixanthobacter sediminis]MXP42986.1 DUF3168 domain-containing protein [Allopontixanthobacter sediminis]